jgi:hypothetical protein
LRDADFTPGLNGDVVPSAVRDCVTAELLNEWCDVRSRSETGELCCEIYAELNEL